MTDAPCRVPGSSYAEDNHGDSDDGDEEFDVIEMTPRHERVPTPRDKQPVEQQAPRNETPLRERPPAHAVHQRVQSAVLPLNLESVDGERQDPSPRGADPFGESDLGSLLMRDPSGASEAPSVQPAHTGMLSGLVSGFARVWGGGGGNDNECESPTDVRDDLRRRPRSGLGTGEPQPSALCVTADIRDGEQASLVEELIFDGGSDREAVTFAAFLKSDGKVPRIPVLCMCDYGSGNYASDLWVLPHNALRRELFDLYEMIGVIRLRYLTLTWGDVYDLRRWWRLFSFFWRQYLAIEDGALTPLVASLLQVDGRREQLRKKIVALEEVREWICCKFEEVDSYMEEFEALPRSKALSLLCMTTDALGFKMLSYFNGQERLLPILVESYHEESVKLRTELQMLNIARGTSFREESFVHLIRWMEAGKPREKWLASHLWWSERSTLGRMYKRYADTHGDAVDRFRQK
jgi:hypothetical protein